METDDQIQHKLFGRGIILTIDGFSEAAKLTIKFSGKNSQVIIAKYVKHVKKVQRSKEVSSSIQ